MLKKTTLLLFVIVITYIVYYCFANTSHDKIVTDIALNVWVQQADGTFSLTEQTGPGKTVRIVPGTKYRIEPVSETSWPELIALVRAKNISGLIWDKKINGGIDDDDLIMLKDLSNLDSLALLNIDAATLIFSSKGRFISDSNKTIRGLSPLDGLKIKELTLSYCYNITDFSALEGLSELDALTLNNCEIENLSFLKSLINLQSLDLSDSVDINDLSPLTNLKKLRRLRLSNCRNITDFSAIEKLTELEALTLKSYEKVENLSFFKDLVNLQSLDLSGSMNINDLSLLTNLKKLRHLSLSNYGKITITGFSVIERLSDLETLTLENYEKTEVLSFLTKGANLQSLDLLYCQDINDLSLLTNLKKLRHLKLSNCRNIADISTLEELTELEELTLESCKKIEDISVLEKLSGLKELNLNFCNKLVFSQIDSLRKTLPECTILHRYQVSQ